jgi:hypothetical protein
MDFLDPKEKRKRGIRLAIGYSLMFVLVVVATIVLVFQAYGFDLDRRGNVVQNGLVFFDSIPDGADIYLNGKKQGPQTNVRLSLAEGIYDIQIRKDGYLPWQNSMQLDGGSVERFYYPLLIPQKLSSQQLGTYQKTPETVLQSPDRRWALVSRPGSINRFDRLDLNNLDGNGQPASNSVAFPAALFRPVSGPQKLKLVEWSDDNKNVLVKYSYRGGDDYLVLNHDKPAESINLDVFFAFDLPSAKLRGKKYDQYYIYSGKNNRLSTADLDGGRPEVLLKNVLAYKPHDDNDLLYTRLSPDKQSIRVVLRLGDKEYVIKELPGRPDVKVNLASFDGDWYPVFTHASEKRAYVYKNPQDIIAGNEAMKPAPIMVLKLHNKPESLAFSANASKVMINNGQEFAVYDIEYDKPYRYKVEEALDGTGRPVWMDGHRLAGLTSGRVLMFDFDGKNAHALAPAIAGLPVVFDSDYERLYTISKSKSKKNPIALLQTDLRIPADL